jgi:ribosome-binding ATPase
MKALAAGHLPHHASPGEPAVAVVKVPDARLVRLAELVKAKKVTHLELRIFDFPSLSVGRKGPSPQLLGSLSTADLLVHVVRGFTDESVAHPLGSVDPVRDIEALQLELTFADLSIIERRLDRLAAEMRSVKAGARGASEREFELLQRLRAGLEAEQPIREQGLSSEDEALLGGFNFLTLKPMLVVLNISEADAARTSEVEAEARARLSRQAVPVVAFAARAEADVAELSPEEAAEFRNELGLPRTPAAARMLQEVVSVLGRITFYTIGPVEARASSIPAGTPASRAAGRVHSDMERGFIRAEVIQCEDLLAAGGHAEAKRKGLLRTEGKSYLVQDCDVINVLFNV